MANKSTCEIDNDGAKKWTLNGVRHREDGPAIEYPDGEKQWVFNNQRHRLDGPAYIGANGLCLWYINDCYVSDEIIQWASDNDIDLDNLTEDDKLMIKLVWADYGK